MLLVSLGVIGLYLLASGLIGARLFHHKGPQHKLSAYAATIAIVLHLYVLLSSIFIEPGQNMSIANVASLIAWLIALSMTIASFRLPSALLLPVVYIFSALAVSLPLLIPLRYIMHIEVQPALLTHITLALFAYGCLVIALLYALQLSYINRRLKQKQASLLHSSLPPLMLVDQILFRLLLVGTIMLALSLLSGFIFLEDMFHQRQVHKTVLSVIAWTVFTATLIGHYRWGWRGRPVITGTVIGTLLLTLAYFGSRFVKEVLLNFSQ